MELHAELCNLVGSDHVYFQPPSSIVLRYPCIIYNLTNIDAIRADDSAYILTDGYEVTYIDKNPDNNIKRRMLERFPKCRFNRFFTNDNLNHYVYTLYY